ncbi:MAG TPA: tetratricopeptide repeat protein [Gaiellaceae bacterium]|nr:tetratricopeptide repeat protein [Gaiellaceae bacterium]
MRRRTTLFMGSALAVALALGGLVGGVLAESRPTTPPSAIPGALAPRALSGTAAGVSAANVADLEEQVGSRPGDSNLLVQLGFAYQLRWRETADASFLPRSEVALRRALRATPDEPYAVLGLGSLALIQHEFRKALAYGRRAEQLLPGSARPFGVIGDALVELGRYQQAFEAFEKMVSTRPNLASYARIAYARELTGDRIGALAAMRLALDAAAGQPEPTAFAHVELAKLELGLSRVSVARRHALAALRALPGYPSARLELARIEAAEGRLDVALALTRRASEAVPTAQAVSLLAELLDRTGRTAEARRQRSTVAVIDRLLQANGVRVDLESAVYRADNRIRPAETVALARRARADRPSIHGDDAFAWALARAGRCQEALPVAKRALRLGTQDALLSFHLGYAKGCAGNRAEMRRWYRRALEIDPAFSVRWARVAQAALGDG